MKKVVFLFMTIMIIIFSGCSKQYKLKEEYESLNGKKTNGQSYIKVTIPKDNSIVYSNYSEIFKVLDSTGIIYIGSAKSQISRDYLNQLLKAIEDTGISKVYYIDISKTKEKTKYKKLLKKINKKEIQIPTMISVKGGKIKEIISETKNISNKKYTPKESKKKEILEKYKNAINIIITCSPDSKNQC
ncbi:MAG: hypothetical protein IKD77_05565 [Bacilli bacterium]|nr:hypothetical protein [Bacilli bacterium]